MKRSRRRTRPTSSRPRYAGRRRRHALWPQMLRRLLLGAIVLAILGGGILYLYSRYGIDRPLPAKAEGYAYSIRKGMTLNQVAAELKQAGILSGTAVTAWKLHARWTGQANRLQAGNYVIPPDSTARDLLALFLQGKTVNYALTLLEGWTFAQVIAAVHRHPKLVHTLEGLNDKAIMRRLGYPDQHPEGRFYPDTYYVDGSTTDVEFLKRAYAKQEQELAAAWAARQGRLPLKSAEEALILASIVEKETGAAEERPRIASVFVERLRRDMLLQTDPTVIYGLGKSFDGNLRRADLRRDTPYNTYTRKGLPPTPIAMPGRAALRAAVNPVAEKNLYFVAKGNGTHHFSKTYPEHECAVVRYQLKKHSSRYASACRRLSGCDACR